MNSEVQPEFFKNDIDLLPIGGAGGVAVVYSVRRRLSYE